MLYLVATPVGNLEDISLRALRVLKEADFILCEDTRVTKKLTLRYGITSSLLSYHQHSRLKKKEKILSLLRQNKNLALVSNAGTPGISDPGNKLIAFLRQKMPEVEMVPVPGASAVALISSVAGISMDNFTFLGFPPAKNKRKKYFASLLTYPHPVVIFESPYRILRTFAELQAVANDNKKAITVVVGRELTKKFERIYWGPLEEVSARLKKETVKGEFVILIKAEDEK